MVLQMSFFSYVKQEKSNAESTSLLYLSCNLWTVGSDRSKNRVRLGHNHIDEDEEYTEPKFDVFSSLPALNFGETSPEVGHEPGVVVVPLHISNTVVVTKFIQCLPTLQIENIVQSLALSKLCDCRLFRFNSRRKTKL